MRWYVAGYVTRKTRRNLIKIGKQELATQITHLLEDEDYDEDTNKTEVDFDDKKWFDLINRGGLTKCNNDFYEYLRAVKLELQMHYITKMDEKRNGTSFLCDKGTSIK